MFGIVLRVSLVALVGAIAFSANPAHAADKSLWASGQDFKAETVDIETPPADDSCSWTFGKVINEITGVGEYKLLCVEHAARLTLASYYRPDGNQRHYAIKIGGDSNYRRLEGLESRYYGLYLIPDSDTIIVRDYRSARGASVPDLAIYRLEDSPFIPKPDSGGIGVLSYSLDEAKRIPLFGYEHNDSEAYAGVSYFVLSKNHRHILAWLEYRAMVVVDTKTLETRGIDMIQGSWYGGKMNSYPGAISDDGRYAFVERSGFLYDTHGCSVPFDYTYYSTLYKTRPCGPGSDSWTNLKDLVDSEVGNTLHNLKYDFVDDAAGLQFAHPQSNPSKLTTIMTESYNSQRLDYLALGDSYSSGEGDTGRIGDTDVKWYRPNTDVDGSESRAEEKCHVSLRSYPYLLAEKMNLDYKTQWQTIACSGATAWDIKGQGSADYLGQNNRLEGFSPDSQRALALNEFIPGRQKQIEFVKKYKPKAITLTIGGNDVDFGGKLISCATYTSTCVFATLEWRGRLKNELQEQFENLSSLYRELITASPSTKIYVLGYPQFINADPRASCQNTLNLNYSEREMIASSIIYLNNIIESAAKSVGVMYVDTENAIGGHRICDEQERHVTEITGYWGWKGNDLQESFHPNSMGHQDIARSVDTAIGGLGVVSHVICPLEKYPCSDSSITEYSATVPPYFMVGDADKDFRVVYYKLTNGTLVKSENTYDANTGSYVFMPDTKVELTLYSDPISLGSYYSSSDGSLDALFIVPGSVHPGYHTLVAEGLAYSGEPIVAYQTIQINGPDPNDIDGDGIEDLRDGCIFFEGDDQLCAERIESGPSIGPGHDVESGDDVGSMDFTAGGQTDRKDDISTDEMGPVAMTAAGVLGEEAQIDGNNALTQTARTTASEDVSIEWVSWLTVTLLLSAFGLVVVYNTKRGEQ